MRGKVHGSQSDEEFVRAADEVLRHLELEHGLAPVVNMTTSIRRTVVSIRIVARNRGSSDPERVVAAVQGEFPNSRASTLAAYVYALTVSLDHTVDAQERASGQTG